MKTLNYEIVNQDLFNETCIDVDVTGLKSIGTDARGKHLGFRGNLSIEFIDRGATTFTGEFGSNDYVNDFGFKIINS